MSSLSPLRPDRLDRSGPDPRALRTIPAAPPATLLPGVLTRVGLADEYVPLQSPIGDVFLAYNGRGVSALVLADEPERFEAGFRAEFGRTARPAARRPERLIGSVMRQLETGRSSGLEFDLRGRTAFERDVLDSALTIPRGQVRPYGWIAREIGRPKAVRAVGSALGANPIPLLIPCHRVVRTDGMIGEYALGTQAKRQMLAWEGVEPSELERLARAGVRYVGSDTNDVFCLPTCRHATRIADGHRRAFASMAAATAAGYRPCLECRPAVAA
jgi:O-6-methylguanine DNA methyltransferase